MSFRQEMTDAYHEMLNIKVSLGYRKQTYTSHILPFIEFCADTYPDADTITKEMLDQWLLTKNFNTDNTRRLAIINIRHFTRYMNAIGKSVYIPSTGNKFRITPISDELLSKFKKYCSYYHKSGNYEDYLFYTKRKGNCVQMSCDAAQALVKEYGIMAQESIPTLPRIHPHLFRHTRAMHLYMAGMPLELVSQWLGHSQMETSLIYARATTDMKRKAIDKIAEKEGSVFKGDEKFKYADKDDVIRQLYGLT